MIFLGLIVHFIGYVAGNCGECQCSPDMSLMACSGDSVFNYPELSPSDKKLIEAIEIQNSYIFTLPIMNQVDYPQLTLAKILDNDNLSCDYVRQWDDALRGQASIITNCVLMTQPEQNWTSSTFFTTAQGTEQPVTDNSTECNSLVTSTSPHGKRIAILTVLISIFSAALIVIVIFTVRCIINRSKQSSLAKRCTSNSIYRMTVIEETESEA